MGDEGRMSLAIDAVRERIEVHRREGDDPDTVRVAPILYKLLKAEVDANTRIETPPSDWDDPPAMELAVSGVIVEADDDLTAIQVVGDG